jgi:hypothetical protein
MSTGLITAQNEPPRFLGATSSQPISITADGSFIAVANPDNDSVTVFDTVTRAEMTSGQSCVSVLHTAPLNLNRGVDLDTAMVPRLFYTNPVAIAWRPDGSDALERVVPAAPNRDAMVPTAGGHDEAWWRSSSISPR